MTADVSIATFPALGSTATVAVAEAGRLGDAQLAVAQVVADFDLACSRFREDSELCALNATSGSPRPVSGLLLDAVAAALRGARLSSGDVDPTIGHALVALGYDRDFDAVAAPEAPAQRHLRLAPTPGWRSVCVDRDQSTITLARGVSLDLGATAKALAADRAAAAAVVAAGCGVLVGLGGDIAIAGAAPSGGWRVRVTDDHRAGFEAPGQWITLRSGGLATSSTTVRRWARHDGAGSTEAHHLVNPATGGPANVFWRTVSVAASSCLDANIASTASIVRGEPAASWLVSLGLPSRLVTRGGRARHVAGWPAEGEELP